MRTIDFSQILFNALQFSGNDRQNIQPETFAQFRDFASTRLREAWETFEWVDVCRIAPFTSIVANAGESLTDPNLLGAFHSNNINQGTRLTSNPAFPSTYQNEIPSTLNRVYLLIQNNGPSDITVTFNQGTSSVTIFRTQSYTVNNYNGGFTLSSFNGVSVHEAFLSKETNSSNTAVVKFFSPAEEAEEILAVFDRNPLSTTRATNQTYKLYNDGVKKVVCPIENGWYAYRTKCPELTGDIYKTNVYYSVGSQVYFDEGSQLGVYTPQEGKPHKGNFYDCILPTVRGESPSSAPHKWRKVQISYVFGSFVAWGSTANWFMSEGMLQEAAVIEAKAKEALEYEYDKATRQQGQFNKLNIIKNY